MKQGIERKVLGDLFTSLFDQRIIVNTIRGFYAEALVAELLGDDWQLVSQDWAGWDLEHVSGVRGEVKQSAALQTWDINQNVSKKMVTPSFDIAPRTGYWKSKDWVEQPGRTADLYFFCWHSNLDEAVADHRLANQWKFFVVRECELPPEQKSINLNKIAKLCPPITSDRLEAITCKKMENG